MGLTRRRVIIGGGALAVLVACSSFTEDTDPPDLTGDGGGPEGGNEVSLTDTAADTAADASVCIPSTPRTATIVTCDGQPDIRVLVDSNNCGACGRRCTGCTNGLCPALVEGNGASGQGGIAMALTSTDVFLAQGAAGGVYRRPRSAAPIVGLAPIPANDSAEGIVVDGDRLFVATVRGVYELSANGDGGTAPIPRLDNAIDSRVGFGQAGPDVFWATVTSSLVFMQKDGGDVRTYGAESGGLVSTGVAYDSAAVFWIRRSDVGAGHEIRVRRADGSVGVRLERLDDPHALTMDATHLYWVSAARQELLRATRTGSDLPVVVARWDDALHRKARFSANDTEHVYWTLGHATDTTDTLLMRAPKACNGQVIPIARQEITTSLVLDGPSVFFASQTNVFRVPR